MKLIDEYEAFRVLSEYYHHRTEGQADALRDALDRVPEAVVRCKDCKYRIVNEHYGERGYMKLKAYCDLDTGDPFELGRNAEDDNWFCADGERRSEDEDHT